MATSSDKEKITDLVIVESPAKAKTIKKFLGKGFEVKASMGHVVDLPQKKLGVDVANNFEPTYEVSPDKTKVVNELKKLAKNMNQVWIATDEDREGEAIGWHVCNALKLDVKKTPRIVFHEITKNAIQAAVKDPRRVDMNLVDAQQGRRVLDRLVGFKVSPILWNKIKRGMSAGRVQSVAVKIIVEREREIQDFKPKESWKCKADLKGDNSKLTVELNKIDGKKAAIKDRESIEKYLKEVGYSIEGAKETNDKKTNYVRLTLKDNIDFELKDIVAKDFKKSPSAPFTTSTLQQTASRMFGRGVKKIMMVAQKLYEHGHITYMRTDSVNLSKEAVQGSVDYIKSTYGESYVKTREYAKKSKNAQEAHEAIRPTHIENAPGSIDATPDEAKLYTLIWNRLIASQMADAKGERTTYHFSPKGKNDEWLVKGEVITFEGWLVIGSKAQKDHDDEVEDDNSGTLPKLDIGNILASDKTVAEQHFSKPPARYTEASLVKALEEKGIGRPSTYAPTISTIQARNYVEKKENKLHPTEMAFLVTDFLAKHFQDMMDYQFTAHMEEKLDKVAEGDVKWTQMMHDFYDKFEKEVKDAGGAEKEVIYTGDKCPECGNKLIFKFSQSGNKFIGCENYPECKHIDQTKEEKDELSGLKEKYEGKPCPEGGTIVVKIGRFGPFLTSSDYPKVKWISSIPDETFDALSAKYAGEKCTKCEKGEMKLKKYKNKYFLACNKYPKCKNTKNIPQKVDGEETPESE